VIDFSKVQVSLTFALKASTPKILWSKWAGKKATAWEKISMAIKIVCRSREENKI